MHMYYIFENEQQSGPFSFDELATKSIKAGTPIWYQGLEDWKRADQLEDLKHLLETAPPPFNLNQPQSHIQQPTQQVQYHQYIPVKQKSGTPVLKIISIAAVIIVLILAGIAATGKSEKLNDVLGKDSYQEKVMTVEEIERSDPARFLEAGGKYRETLFGKNYRIFGEILNSATVANYRNAVVRVTFYDVSETTIQEKDYLIAEAFPVHSSTKFELKIERPSACKTLGWKVVNALPY